MGRLAANRSLSDTRKRDLRSAVVSFGKLTDRAPAAIPVDLASIRATLDAMVPAQAKVSRKRWANLRSDLASAIEASGLRPMLKTGDMTLDESWSGLLQPMTDQGVRNGLSRLARWASQCRIAPEAVDDTVIERFIAELEAASLIRNIHNLHRSVATSWNSLVRLQSGQGLQTVKAPTHKPAPRRVPWEQLPAAFRAEVDRHLAWCAMPDPLDEHARARALAPRTVDLRRDHIHSAVTAAIAAGIAVQELTSLANLVEIETFKVLLRHRWEEGGRALTAYTHGIAGSLIAIAAEWVKVPADTLATLKALRRKLGTLPPGLTEKNKALLRKFDDPRLLEELIELPDRLWRRARRDLATSRRPFIDLQSALAIDLLIHVPLRMENLSELNFEQHLHWLQGRGKPALIVFGLGETKNDFQLEYEIATVLAERLQIYRNEIAPAVTDKRPDAVFVTWAGKPRTQGAITTAIEKTILRHLGVKMTPHQFRHLAAKIILDANPGAYELVRQMLGHKNMKTTTNFYAGIDTRRAGRAHADLIMKLRESEIGRKRSRRKTESEKAQWPAADRQLWERAMGNDDPFCDAAGSRLAKTSQNQYLFAWRRFLGFLVVEEPSALDVAPAERLTIERIRQFVGHLAETNKPESVAIQVDALYKATRVMMPDHDWTWLKSVKARLHAAAPSHSSTGPVITSVQLLDLGQELMDESRPSLNTPIRTADAVRYRDGLMFALLAFIPLRRKNVAIEIGRHLVQDGDGWFIVIPCTETKTSTPIEFAVPELLGPCLATYLNVVRPRLLRRPSNALWISQKGGALSYSAVWGVITRHTTRRLGVRIAPHDMRDAAATTWAVAAPDQIGVARDLLAHSDLRTTTRHYNRARGIEASRAYTQLIAKKRKK